MVQVREDVDPEPLAPDESVDRDHPVDAPGVEVDDPPLVVLLEPAESVRRPLRVGEPLRRVELVAVYDILGAEELLQSFLLENALAVGCRTLEEETHPLRHVGNARPDRARGRHRVYARVLDDLDLAVDTVVRGGDVPHTLKP